jgi:nitroreductase
MDFSQLIQTRSSIRGYLDTPVDQDKLDLILEAARAAPTAANRQPFRVIVVRDRALRTALAAAYSREWFYNAPTVLVVCGVPSEAWVRVDGFESLVADAAIVTDHMTLQATDLGLGTCWVANFAPGEVTRALNLPDTVVPLFMTPLGYPATSGRPKERRSREELVYWDVVTPADPDS